MILASPIEDKCTSARLQGCEDLTEGVLLYVEGNAPEGKIKVRKAVRANSPADVKAFADLTGLIAEEDKRDLVFFMSEMDTVYLKRTHARIAKGREDAERKAKADADRKRRRR